MDKYILTEENFDFFTYSKRTHLDSFSRPNDLLKFDIDAVHPKFYQDLFIYTFLLQNIPRGSKILEIGGGDSRVYNWFRDYYTFTILDKFEGSGNGLQKIPPHLKKDVVKDYIGGFNKELKEESFDCIFSISVLEHVPQTEEVVNNILNDIDRLLKPNAYSVHCIDCILKNKNYYWNHPILDKMFSLSNSQNKFTANELVSNDDFYFMNERTYDKTWKIHTKKSYCEHGKAFSANVVYKKSKL